jgi:sorbose reductase
MSMSIEECATPRPPKPVPATPDNVFEQLSMKGRLVCITGASDGIGFAVAEAMAEAGANLALWYNSNDAAISKGAQLTSKHGIKVKAYQVEVSDPLKVQQAIAATTQDFGHLDVFIANAGMAISKPILEQTIEEYRKQMSVNLDGAFFCAKYAGEVFKRQGRGQPDYHLQHFGSHCKCSGRSASLQHHESCCHAPWQEFGPGVARIRPCEYR